MNERAAGVRRLVCDVVAEAVRASGAPGVLVLADWTPEGELLYEWLVAALGEARVWREAGHVTSGGAAPLTAHPANRTALMLGGRPPATDLLPFGDLLASRVATLAGAWSAPEAVQVLAATAGGIQRLDDVLELLLDRRVPLETATRGLDDGAAAAFRDAWHGGRWYRAHVRLVPKLSARTLGIDLFD